MSYRERLWWNKWYSLLSTFLQSSCRIRFNFFFFYHQYVSSHTCADLSVSLNSTRVFMSHKYLSYAFLTYIAQLIIKKYVRMHVSYVHTCSVLDPFFLYTLPLPPPHTHTHTNTIDSLFLPSSSQAKLSDFDSVAWLSTSILSITLHGVVLYLCSESAIFVSRAYQYNMYI